MTQIALATTPVVALGASGAMGLRDLWQFLESPLHCCPAVFLVVLHRPFDTPSRLREVLQARSSIPVEIARAGAVLRPGVCYIGEPASHLTLGSGRRAVLISDPRANHRNRTVDALFTSVATHAGRLATGIVLSGCLADGVMGLKEIKRVGGTAMARWPDATALTDMPRNAIRRAGPLDQVGAVGRLAAEVVRRVQLSSPSPPQVAA